jgi:hypothetical protein
MKITSVDPQRNLFFVQDVYPVDILNQLDALDHFAGPHEKVDWQEHFPRRRLLDTAYKMLNDHIITQLPFISEQTGLNLKTCYTDMWLDETGFSMESHLDNPGVTNAMQVYLNHNNLNLGTCFYNAKKQLRFQVPYLFNCGYIMINGAEQYHGAPSRVPADTYRLNSYTHLKE